MADATETAVLAALDGAYGGAPKAPAAPAAKTAPEPVATEEITLEPIPDEGEPAEVAEPTEPEPAIAEPEFEIEVNGQKEIVRGKEKIKELLQKATHYSRGTEEVARVREALVAQARSQQDMQQFQQAAMGDIAELQAIDKQLEQFNKVDWANAIDTDFVTVMKLQEQRAALREARNAKLGELNAKQQQFQQSQAQATQQMLVAEESALLAKLPEWRNSEKATAEKQAITSALKEYGYQAGELAQLNDHRAILVARDAMKWRELQRSKTDKVKQLRDAPPVSKPGAASGQQTNEKAAFAKQVQEYRQQGRKGQVRAQEASLEKIFSRTFK